MARRFHRIYVDSYLAFHHPPSLPELCCTATLSDLRSHFLRGIITPKQYIEFVHRRRKMLRFKNRLGDEQCLCYATGTMLSEEYAQALEKASALSMADLRSQPLSGFVFDVQDDKETDWKNGTDQVRIDKASTHTIVKHLEEKGAIHWGVTAPPYVQLPETHLPHPLDGRIAFGGSSGSSALSLALGLSSFSVGTNGGSTNRISSGLLGLCGVYLGDKTFTENGDCISHFQGFLTRTPHDASLLVGAVSGENPADTTTWLRTLHAHTDQIGYFSEFADVKPDPLVCVPGTHSQPSVSTHPDVKMWFDEMIDHLTQRRFPLVDMNGRLPSIARPFLSHCLGHEQQQTAHDYSITPYETSKLFEEPSELMKKYVASNKAVSTSIQKARDAATEEHIYHLSHCSYILTPLLRIPFWARSPCKSEVPNPWQEKHALPTHKAVFDGTERSVIDPAFNDYCVLGNQWQTPSVVIPLRIKTDVFEKENIELPFGLLLTCAPTKPNDGQGTHGKEPVHSHPLQGEVPQMTNESLKKLLHAAHRIHCALEDFHPPLMPLKELYDNEEGEDVRVHFPDER